MRHLEIHIIQSVPVSCLNRDDFGSPKKAVFGNVPRARVSSQCLKRAIREKMREELPANFAGTRSRLIINPLCSKLVAHGLEASEAQTAAEGICNQLAKLDNPPTQVKTLFFTSPKELETLAEAYAETKDVKKSIKAMGKTLPGDAADIALFGRMVASDHTLTIEGAAMFTHALSTHRISNEIDFFSAIDDLKAEDAEDAGAGMTGTLEFNSATYYRFAAVNLDMLKDAAHLGSLTKKERQQIMKTFVKSTIMAMPSARHNSMYAASLPSYVLTVIREKGHPIQLANAFEEPVWTAKGGLVTASTEKLKAEYETLKSTYGIEAVAELIIPEITQEQLLAEVDKYVQ